MDISVLIQGPLNRISLDNLEYYKSIGPVVISYWENDPFEFLHEYDLINCTLITKPVPSYNRYHHVSGSDTFNYQINSIFNGFSVVKTPYVIRTRSDEMWGNLSPLIEKFTKDMQKVVCGNIFFRKWSQYQYHIGDHLFIGDTKRLLNIYQLALDCFEKYANERTPESIIGLAALDLAEFERSKDNFIKIFDVIDINLLKPFVAHYRHNNQWFRDDFNDGSCAKTIEEL